MRLITSMHNNIANLIRILQKCLKLFLKYKKNQRSFKAVNFFQLKNNCQLPMSQRIMNYLLKSILKRNEIF